MLDAVISDILGCESQSGLAVSKAAMMVAVGAGTRCSQRVATCNEFESMTGVLRLLLFDFIGYRTGAVLESKTSS